MTENYRNPNKQSDVDDPNWYNAGKVHDWRNHIGGNIRKV